MKEEKSKKVRILRRKKKWGVENYTIEKLSLIRGETVHLLVSCTQKKKEE
jgi:hypothetical protein